MQNHKHKQEDLQRIKRMRLIDDSFMTKCFEDIECTNFLLQIILERTDLKVQEVRTQRNLRSLQGRSITLDIYAVDQSGKRYNIEVQQDDREAQPKRARYHSALLDADELKKGQDFGNLSETYVIFITENDVLAGGLPIYHIDRMIRETGAYFGDAEHIIYVNGRCRDASPIGILMHDFFCADPENMQYHILADRARYFKDTEEGISDMCKIMEELRDETARETARETAKEIAKKLIGLGELSLEMIAQTTSLSLDEVKALSKQEEA